MEEKGLKEEIKELKEALIKETDTNKKDKAKRFRIPRKARVGKAKVKRNWITVLQLYENRNAKFTRQRIQEQTTVIDGVPRIATADNIFLIEGRSRKPLIVQCMWSVKPTSPSDNEFLNIPENYNDTEKKGLNAKGYKHLMNRMKLEAITNKKPVPWWIWLVGLGILGVAVYFLMQRN